MVRPDIIAIYHYWLVPKGRLRVKAAKLADIRAGDSDDNYFGAMMAGKLGTPGAMTAERNSDPQGPRILICAPAITAPAIERLECET